jgi:hypothetical protein
MPHATRPSPRLNELVRLLWTTCYKSWAELSVCWHQTSHIVDLVQPSYKRKNPYSSIRAAFFIGRNRNFDRKVNLGDIYILTVIVQGLRATLRLWT